MVGGKPAPPQRTSNAAWGGTTDETTSASGTCLGSNSNNTDDSGRSAPAKSCWPSEKGVGLAAGNGTRHPAIIYLR